MHDLDAATDAFQDATQLWPNNDEISMLVAMMQSLSETWLYRSQISQDPSDAGESHHSAMDARNVALAHNRPDTAMLRNQIGKGVGEWFHLNCLCGLVEHNTLADAIYWFDHALEICSPSDALYAEIVGNLAQTNILQFKNGGGLAHLDKAIELYTTAVNLAHDATSDDHKLRLLLLVHALILRQEETKPDNHDDFDRALEYCHAALASLPENHQTRHAFLEHMVTVHAYHHDNSNTEPYRDDLTEPNYVLQIPHMDKCIEYMREAARICHPTHHRYIPLLEGLRELLLDRYRLTFLLCDIDEVIDSNRRIVALHPVGNPNRKRVLMFLADALNTRYQRHGLHLPTDFQETMDIWGEALSIQTDYDWWAEDSIGSQMLDAVMWQARYETRLAEERGEEGPMSGIPDIDPWSVPMMEVDLDKPVSFDVDVF